MAFGDYVNARLSPGTDGAALYTTYTSGNAYAADFNPNWYHIAQTPYLAPAIQETFRYTNPGPDPEVIDDKRLMDLMAKAFEQANTKAVEEAVFGIKPEKETPRMRQLFTVYFVDPDAGLVVDSVEVVAVDASKAQAKAQSAAVGLSDYDLDDLDIIVKAIGPVRAKKEVQTVRVAAD